MLLMVLAAYAAAQESRTQMSVRIADEESATASQTAKVPKPSKPSPKKKEVAQSWPKSGPAQASKKRSSSQGWSGKSGK